MIFSLQECAAAVHAPKLPGSRISTARRPRCFLGVAHEAFAQLREHDVTGMNQDNSKHVLSQAGIELDRLAHKIVDGAGGFNAESSEIVVF